MSSFKQRNPEFPMNQLLHENFFSHIGIYDLIIEQTFFCSFVPTEVNRTAYFKKMSDLLKPKGKLVGLWFNFPLSDDTEKRPFGGDKKLYNTYLNLYFNTKIFEKCYNSIQKRENKELFGIFEKKNIKKNHNLIVVFGCGERGIRTPGGVTLASFQDWCIRPLCHFSSVSH